MSKLLLALQYWEGDRVQAEKLARFICDLEPSHSDLADVLLVNRHDCLPFPPEADQYISRKFNLWKYHAPRGNVGWPGGCNSLWINTMRWVQSMSDAARIPRYKAVFTFESDGCPVFRDWVLRMHRAWDLANEKGPVCVAGPIVQIPGEHMNGNLMVGGSSANMKWMIRTADSLKQNAGWDWALSPQFKKRGWANVPGMVSWYNTRGYTEAQFLKAQADQMIWIHGVKDDSLMTHGRKLLLGEPLI